MLKRRYAPAEHLLAQRLFLAAKAQGRLKSPPGLGAVATSNGLVRPYAGAAVTYRDYLRDARKMLEGRTKRRRLTK